MTIIKKFEPVEEKKTSFPKKYLAPVGFFFFLLIVAEIWVNNAIITYGDKFESLSSLTSSLTTENQVLENEIAKKTSLSDIASKSASLGFSQPESIQYIR